MKKLLILIMLIGLPVYAEDYIQLCQQGNCAVHKVKDIKDVKVSQNNYSYLLELYKKDGTVHFVSTSDKNELFNAYMNITQRRKSANHWSYEKFEQVYLEGDPEYIFHKPEIRGVQQVWSDND